MNRAINVAFLGGGINSAVGRTHRIAVEMDGRFKLVAGCFSRHIEINRRSAQEYGVAQERVYENLEAMLEKEKQIDAVCVLTPTPNHQEEILTCLRHGFDVISEKALTTSSAGALAIKKTLEETGRFLAVTYNYTGYPMLRELKHMIETGRLGKIEQVHVEMPQESFARLDEEGNPKKPQDWRLHDRELPMISLDLGTHTHDLVSFLTGESPVELVARQDTFGSFRDIVDNSVCIANYTGGIVSTVWFSKAALGHRNGLRVRVYGEEGSAQWYQMEPEYLHFVDNKGGQFVLDRGGAGVQIASRERYNRFKAGHPSGFLEAFANYYVDIADLMQGKTENENRYVFGVDDAIEGLKMLEAMTRSSREKQWVRV